VYVDALFVCLLIFKKI